MRLDRVEPLEVEQRLDIAIAGGIAIKYGLKINPQRRSQLRLIGIGLEEGLPDEVGAHGRMIEALGKAMHDSIFQPGWFKTVSQMKEASAGSCCTVSSASARTRSQIGSNSTGRAAGCV